MMKEIIITPIGIVHSHLVSRYEAPRQGILAGSDESFIELFPNKNFEQAVKDLNGFERIWVLYNFHLNNNWKPLVTPPRHTRKKIGVFATRAPYRPNQIGMSCVKLEKIEGLKIFISQSDILDGSPVIDIKPYIPYSDSFPNAATGWVKSGMEEIHEVNFDPVSESQMIWLRKNGNINLKSFTRLQLEFSPTDSTRKRIAVIGSEGTEKIFTLAYRTWRILFTVNEEKKIVDIKKIFSAYTKEELMNQNDDKYNDKKLHNMFVNEFAL